MRVRLLLVSVLSLGGYAFASPIGTLGIGSSGVVNATLTSILFTADPGALGVCPGAPCNGDVNTGTTLTFSGGSLTTNEGILINGGLPFGTPPPGSAGTFNPFLQFAMNPGLLFFISGVDPGSSVLNCAGLTNGQSCSINVAGTPSPVLLTRNGTNTNVSISLFGVAVDASGSSNWTGGFSATIPNQTPLQIEQFFCGADAICTAAEAAASPTLEVRSTSGSFFATAVPEPNTTVLLGAGLILLSLTLRRMKVV
ncbi:MAG: PEP-CTERM sorting domain-containing protein [Candidatus Solibacter sp.]